VDADMEEIPSTFKVITPPVLLSLDATVSELIDANTRGWNCSLLDVLFSREEEEKFSKSH
jgi:hypothetical protein